MKITYNNTTIDFFDFPKVEQITVSLSGGLDSASAFYLACKHFPDIEYIPFSARDLNAPKDAEAAELIVKWMQTEFPNVKINDIQIFDFNDRTEEFVSYEMCDLAIKLNKNFSKLNRVQVSKILQLDNIAKKILGKYPKATRLDGMTANPPKKVMKREGWNEKAERRRDQKTRRQTNKYRLHQPFVNVDKKFVADIYKQNNLMETLFPLTRSCVGTAKQTDNFTRECHQCFWCHEKKWAFDLEWND